MVHLFSDLMIKVVCVCYHKMLKDELTQLNKKLTQLGDVAVHLSAQLDPVTSTAVTDSQATLDRQADKLQSRLQQHYAQLESTMDEHSRFAEKYRIIDAFVKTLPREESRLSSVSIPLIQQSIVSVKETLMKIENMRPEMTRLNELGCELSLAGDDANKLTELNERWETMCRDKNMEVKELEQRLLALDEFYARCEQWTQFVSCVDTDLLQHPSCSYESLLEEQEKVKVPFIRHCNLLVH